MHALRVLEFQAIRERLQYHCETSLGGAHASELLPAFDAEEVWRAQGLTKEAYELIARHSVPSLGAVRDVRAGLERAQKGGSLGGQEIFEIGDTLASMRAMRTFLSGRKADAPELWRRGEGLPEIPRLESAIFDSLEPDGTVKDAASPQLATLRQKKKSTNSRIQERIQSYISGGTRDLLSDPIYTVRDGRYVLPLKAENRGKIRGIVHDTSSSGSTIFIEPEDVLQLGNALREIESHEREEISRILTALSGKVGGVAPQAREGIAAAGFIDFVLARAKLGFAMKGTAPMPLSGHAIEIQGGRHPLLDPEKVVPLDLKVGHQPRNVLITGPNTGGKTVAIKCAGLFVLMAQAGLMVPALHFRLGPFTQVWADIGDEQSLEQSLSTFSGHIKNIAEALGSLKVGALALFDELGAGTDPAEGAALARAILLTMNARGAVILASTHYGELKAFAYNTEGFENAAMEFDPKSLRPTYRLLMGAPGASQALRIAERYGIAKDVVELAREGLSEQHQDIARMLEQLDQAQRRARVAQSEADKRTAELKRQEETTATKLAEADEIRRNANTKAQGLIEEALREIRLEAARLFDELKQSGTSQQSLDQARKGLKELQEVGTDFAKEFAPKKKVSKSAPVGLEKGTAVKVEGYTQPGTVLELKGENVVVQMGILKMTVPATSVSLGQAVKPTVKPRVNLGLQKAMTATTELHLRNMRAEDAIDELEKFIDDAVLGGLPSVRIVHGKGEGILRKIVQEYLKKNKNVSGYRDGEPAEGGHGVTIAMFR